jgi:hypothetical protein
MWLVLNKRPHVNSGLQVLVAVWVAVGLTFVIASGEGLWWRL